MVVHLNAYSWNVNNETEDADTFCGMTTMHANVGRRLKEKDEKKKKKQKKYT